MAEAGFLAKLLAAARRNQSLLCVGLDPDPDRLPANLRGRPDGVARFVQGIVAATADLVCAFKPNLAFYEALGAEGWALLRAVVAAVPPDLPVIADAKRGDVASTSAAYARALFDWLGVDAVTVSPYLGRDALAPFLARADRGVLVLCKTSNPGSGDLQDLTVETAAGRRPLWEHVARQVVAWNAAGNCGLVVGATYPDQLARVRQLAPELPILVPGVGAQAGDLAAAVRNGVDARGERAIINVARAVLYASDGPDWAEAARRAAERYRTEINRERPGAR